MEYRNNTGEYAVSPTSQNKNIAFRKVGHFDTQMSFIMTEFCNQNIKSTFPNGKVNRKIIFKGNIL